MAIFASRAALSLSSPHILTRTWGTAVFPYSTKVMDSLKKELHSYYTSKGTIRFSADKPLPAALINKLVKARIEEIETRN